MRAVSERFVQNREELVKGPCVALRGHVFGVGKRLFP